MKTAPLPVVAVRAIIVDDDGRVLVLRRQSGSTGAGGWCLPGGKVDYGETVEQAIRREILEETALECEAAKFLFYQDSPPFEPGGMHCVNLYFECRCRGALRLDHESSEHRWIAPLERAGIDMVFRNGEGLSMYWAGRLHE